MRTALAACLLLMLGCSPESAQPTSSAAPITEAPTATASIPSPGPEVEAAARVAVRYVDAVRRHDARAIYELAWSGLRKEESREQFVARSDLDGVTNARLSGVVEVGWDAEGRRMAIAPVIVTAGGVPQIGRVLLLRESGRWRYFDLAAPDQVPDLARQRP